ncbi:MAG: beta-ketoacyl synthase chain length factor [Parvibaculum sp.]|nr:beta-ketoacyl synthase chain length factor [Parvibaculum sp.]
MNSAIYVESWAAMILRGPDAEPRRLGQCKDESVIPAGHRRRLGSYGRMAVTCGLSVAGADSSDLVFCSRYGDVDLAYGLLKSLAVGEILSPAAFSLSVHNSVPGVMDLVRKSRVGHTAIAAGAQSLSAGLAEAWAKLAAKPEQTITLVFAEGELPPDLKPFSEVQGYGLALAMTLSATNSNQALGQFSFESIGDGRAASADMTSEELAGKIAFLLDASERRIDPLHWRSRGLEWSFSACTDA